jgi:phospholipid-binding lipoprotein MlaA
MKIIKVFAFALTLLLSSNLNAATKDCFEKVNRATFAFNNALDKTIFKPVATGYSYLPQPVKSGVNNATSNILYLITIPNDILQGNFSNALNNSGRFLVNTTFGILGLFDPAQKIGLEKLEHEDYGQTLGAWGVGPGCYFLLPILGPTTVRDAVGRIGNTLLDPFYIATVGDRELMNSDFPERVYYIEKGLDVTDFRANNLKSFENLEKNSVDLYASIRSLYLQRRENLISNNSTPKDEWKDFK